MRQDRRIFYGWWVVVGLFFSTFLGSWGRSALGTFAPEISKDIGWTTSQMMLSVTIALLVYAFALIFVGRLLDTLGGKQVVTIGSVLLTFGFVLLSLVRELWQLYLIHGLLLGVAVAMLHTVPSQAVARKWFVKHASLLSGILVAAFSVSQAILAPLLTQSAASIGWRASSLILASFGVVIFILARCIIKDTPESLGLRPYGAEESKNGANSVITPEVSVPLSQSLRTVSFWGLCLAGGLAGIPVQGLTANIVVWGAGITGDLARAGLFATALSLPAIPGKILWGSLGDRFGKRKIGILSSTLACAAMIATWLWVNDAPSLYAMSILNGLVYSGCVVVIAPYLGDLFGRASIGALIGYCTAAHGLFGAMGPLLWSAIFDITGRYNNAALISAVIYILMAVCFALARPLNRSRLQGA